MFRFASKVRFVKTSIQPVGYQSIWSRNYAAATQDVKGFINYTEHLKYYTQNLNHDARKALDAGANSTDLKQGIRMAVDEVVRNLNSKARRISTFEEIAQVGTTAADGETEIGEVIANAIQKVEEDDIYIVPDGKALHDEFDFFPGMKLKWDSIPRTYECVLNNPFVLISETKISNLNIIKQAILTCLQSGSPLLIIAEDVNYEARKKIEDDVWLDNTLVCIVTTARFGEDKRAITEDLAVLTGGRVLTESVDANFTFLVPLMLGSCKQVRVTMDRNDTFGGYCESDNWKDIKIKGRREQVIILGGSGDWQDIQERCEQLRSIVGSGKPDYKLKNRLAKLSGGVAVYKVCGVNESEMSEKEVVVAYALNAAKVAVEEGIVPCGGVSLLHASKELDKLQNTNSSQKIGVQLVQNALKTPVYMIAAKNGVDDSFVEKLLEQNNSNLGYDPTTGKYADMLECGIVDPLKSVISEFMGANARSIDFIEEYNQRLTCGE